MSKGTRWTAPVGYAGLLLLVACGGLVAVSPLFAKHSSDFGTVGYCVGVGAWVGLAAAIIAAVAETVDRRRRTRTAHAPR